MGDVEVPLLLLLFNLLLHRHVLLLLGHPSLERLPGKGEEEQGAAEDELMKNVILIKIEEKRVVVV